MHTALELPSVRRTPLSFLSVRILTRMLATLPALLILVHCGAPETGEWAEVLERIEAEFPGVPRIPPDELERRLAEEGAKRPLLVDTRSAEEFAVSHLPGALHAVSAAEVESLPGYRPDRPLVVYCSVGYRSSALAARLLQRGHPEVLNLEGSIFRWANQGRPLERAGREVRQVHPYSENWGRLLNRELWAWAPDDR